MTYIIEKVQYIIDIALSSFYFSHLGFRLILMEEQNKSGFTISKKTFYAMIPNAGIVVTLIAMGKSAPAILFLLGVIGGIIIGRYSMSN